MLTHGGSRAEIASRGRRWWLTGDSQVIRRHKRWGHTFPKDLAPLGNGP